MTVELNRKVLFVKGDKQHYAFIEENLGGFYIIDGWNCGTVTATIKFPGLRFAQYYLAGLWNCSSRAISVADYRDWLDN